MASFWFNSLKDNNKKQNISLTKLKYKSKHRQQHYALISLEMILLISKCKEDQDYKGKKKYYYYDVKINMVPNITGTQTLNQKNA